MIKYFFPILVASLALNSTVIADDDIRYNQVSFNVSAEADIANDQLVIVMTALEKGRDLEKLADTVNKTMTWALKEADKLENIKAQTLNYSTQPNYSKGKQTGWQVSQSLSLKSTSTEDLSDLMSRLQTRLQVQSASYQVTTDKKNQLTDKLTTDALALFSQKAEKIASALQHKSYKIVQINLHSDSPGHPRPMVGMARSMMASEAVTAPSFEPGTQKVSVTASGTIEVTN